MKYKVGRFLRAKSTFESFVNSSGRVTARRQAVRGAFAYVFLQVGGLNEANGVPGTLVRANHLRRAAVLHGVSRGRDRSTVLAVDVFRIASASNNAINIRDLVDLILQARLITRRAAKHATMGTLHLTICLFNRSTMFPSVLTRYATIRAFAFNIGRARFNRFPRGVRGATHAIAFLRKVLLYVEQGLTRAEGLTTWYVGINRFRIGANLINRDRGVRRNV